MGSNHLSAICSPFVYLKSYNGLGFISLFVSSCAGKGPYVREGVKSMIFIFNPNPTCLSFFLFFL